ncbi:MAG: hypothetical protein KAI81_00675, partial [Candidatus Marinimicrobia bacterium]|nr:hypothetical protein [Candidatus Neomarinimicrobiota bacterium]
APDFFGKQYLLLQQSYYSTSIGKMTGGYTLTIDEKSEDVFSHDLAGSWKASIAETYISAYGEYLLTDGKMGNSVLNLTRNFGHKVLVNLDYRVVLQKNWIIDAEDDVYFTGHAYDVFRLGAFYELSQKLALEFSSLSTAYKNDSYYNTYLELISKVGGLGVVYVNTPHGSEINLSAKASYSLFKDALNLEAGYNYITEEISFDETENASGSGSYFGLKYHILNGLNVRLNYYKMDSPQFNSNSRLLLKLNYRLSI